MNLRLSAVVTLALLLSPIPAFAQGATPLTVESIFGKDAVRGESSATGEWTRDGQGYIAIEPAKDGGSDLVRYDASGANRRVLVAAREDGRWQAGRDRGLQLLV